MKSKLINDSAGQRTYAVILSAGDEAILCLKQFAADERLSAAAITGIGAFQSAELAYFDWEAKKYHPIPVQEQVEVASLIGDVAVDPDGKPAIHVHAVLGKRDGTAVAGHLLKADVRPTLEIILTESPSHLRKRVERESGLALVAIDAPAS